MVDGVKAGETQLGIFFSQFPQGRVEEGIFRPNSQDGAYSIFLRN